jgi:hypothetical protein
VRTVINVIGVGQPGPAGPPWEITPALTAGPDNQAALQAWLDQSEDGVLRFDASANSAGQLSLNSNTKIVGDPNNAVLSQTRQSSNGSFLVTNIPGAPQGPSENIEVEDLRISGADYPAPVYYQIVSGTLTTVVLPVGSPAPDANFVQFCTGADGLVAKFKRIVSYDATTRTITFSSLAVLPQPGDWIVIGSNDNAIAGVGGCYGFHIWGGEFADYPQSSMVPFARGGKGVNFEQGVTDGFVWGSTFRNLTTAVFAQGVASLFPSGEMRRAYGIRYGGYHATNCGSVLSFAGIDGAVPPDGDARKSLLMASFITYENCGHAPLRIVSSDHQKCGVINLMEAQNFSITNVSGWNADTYPNVSPGYPTDFATRVGYGLSGPIGAMIWGVGRNGYINNFQHHGNVDAVIAIRRDRALGDDEGPDGQARNCYNLIFRNIQHFGVADYAVTVDPVGSLAVPPTELTGEFQVVVDTLTLGICGTGMSVYQSITLDITERATGKRVIGTPGQIVADGNTFASFPDHLTDLRNDILVTLADDEAVQINPPRRSGFMQFTLYPGTSTSSGVWGIVAYNTFSAAEVGVVGAGANVSVGTTALTTGTSNGVDGNFNIAAVVATLNGIYLKNRRGATRSWRVRFL